MILFPGMTGLDEASRVGGNGSTWKIPVLDPVSVAVKVSMSPESDSVTVIWTVSGTTGFTLHAAAFA